LGEKFAHWAIIFFVQFIENYRSSANYWDTFFQTTSCELGYFDKKIGWAALWATFSKTHLVTLQCGLNRAREA
jgi:hypothetical protein